jgi:metallo-beta-lactamase family protein
MFGGKRVQFVLSVEESKALNHREGPCIIIAASGMCETGRIVHHLKYNLEDARNTVLVIGFQAPETLGRRLVEKKPEVRIHDRMVKVQAEIKIMNGFSSHADHEDILSALRPLEGQGARIFLVHGEPDAAETLAKDLRNRNFSEVAVPARGESIA